jgi:hypothetical protein
VFNDTTLSMVHPMIVMNLCHKSFNIDIIHVLVHLNTLFKKYRVMLLLINGQQQGKYLFYDSSSEI